MPNIQHLVLFNFFIMSHRPGWWYTFHVLFLMLNGTPAALKCLGGSRGPGIVKGKRPDIKK